METKTRGEPDRVDAALESVGKKRLPSSSYRHIFGNSAQDGNEAFHRDFAPVIEYFGERTAAKTASVLLSHGSDGFSALREAFANAHSPASPVPLWAALAAIDSVQRWALKDGQIKWSVDNVATGQMRIAAEVPREFGREVRVAAAKADLSVPGFIVKVLSAAIAQNEQAKKGATR